ncbi:MAG: cysteine desulfurase [Chthonomonadales bacterium]|nr:cysteine desulfurase [Chthonomonadales bacterium]
MSLQVLDRQIDGSFDVERIREDFPALAQTVRGRPLVYLDNAATTQKPLHVLDAMRRFYTEDNANIHRGVHSLSQRATDAYECARCVVRRFMNAPDNREIIYVRGTTEAINLVASSYGSIALGPGREVLVTELEHHANIVPWQMACERFGATLRVVPITDEGELRLDTLAGMLSSKTAIVAVGHASNALGTVNPIREICRMAHEAGAAVLVDGAQAAGHLPVDVQSLGCDFYAFSGHKALGPTGIGVLWGRMSLLEQMPPYQGGGDMIRTVSFEKTTYSDVPGKFEAGTPHIAGVIGLGAALEYLMACDRVAMEAHERDLLQYATERLSAINGLTVVGTAPNKIGIVSFVMDAAHPHDIGTIADLQGVAIRTGHHCAMPLMKRLCLPATARASFALYNTRAEVDALADALERVHGLFSGG